MGKEERDAPDLETARQQLEEAQRAYEEAHSQAEAARRESTRLLNEANEKQRQFDKTVRAVKEGAPRDTDWARQKNTFTTSE